MTDGVDTGCRRCIDCRRHCLCRLSVIQKRVLMDSQRSIVILLLLRSEKNHLYIGHKVPIEHPLIIQVINLILENEALRKVVAQHAMVWVVFSHVLAQRKGMPL